jgi:NSS family neurotransmitter:Na+ symporter
MTKNREHWGSKLGFIIAAAGSAIGLGNLWRFPTIVGQNGGGAFVLMYLIMVFVIGIPVLIVELMIGRKTQLNGVGAFKMLRPKTPWKYVGVMGIAAGFIILSFYSVIAGWSMSYLFKFLQGTFTGLSPADIAQEFGSLASHPILPVFWHGLFMVLTIGVVILGVDKGIERWSKILMPILFVLMIILCIRSLTLDGALEGVYWLFRPDFASVDFNAVLTALGQVFFSLSIGMGVILTYGSYLSPEENIPGCATYIAFADLGVALLASVAIIPAVFAFGLDPETGPSLIFLTLPAVFQSMPWGSFIGAMFFLLVTIAALTSSISLLETVVAYFIDERKWPRSFATPICGLIIFILGIFSSLSQGPLKDFKIFGLQILDFKDALTANVMLPLGGLLMVIFVGWVMGPKNAIAELETGGNQFALGKVWAFLVRWVLPVAMIIILLSGLLQ